MDGSGDQKLLLRGCTDANPELDVAKNNAREVRSARSLITVYHLYYVVCR